MFEDEFFLHISLFIKCYFYLYSWRVTQILFFPEVKLSPTLIIDLTFYSLVYELKITYPIIFSQPKKGRLTYKMSS